MIVKVRLGRHTRWVSREFRFTRALLAIPVALVLWCVVAVSPLSYALTVTLVLPVVVVIGVAAMVEGVVDRMAGELGVETADLTVVATGYLAGLVLEECRCFTHHDPWLTFKGLGLVFERNS